MFNMHFITLTLFLKLDRINLLYFDLNQNLETTSTWQLTVDSASSDLKELLTLKEINFYKYKKNGGLKSYLAYTLNLNELIH